MTELERGECKWAQQAAVISGLRVPCPQRRRGAAAEAAATHLVEFYVPNSPRNGRRRKAAQRR